MDIDTNLTSSINGMNVLDAWKEAESMYQIVSSTDGYYIESDGVLNGPIADEQIALKKLNRRIFCKAATLMGYTGIEVYTNPPFSIAFSRGRNETLHLLKWCVKEKEEILSMGDRIKTYKFPV